MLQSMFVVTFTSNRDSRWLYETLVYLFENVEHLQDEAFGHQFVIFLEALAVRYADGRLFTEDGQEFRCYPNMPIYAFNFTDYVLWKNKIIYRSTFLIQGILDSLIVVPLNIGILRIQILKIVGC